MKKIFTSILSIVLAVCLISCGKKTDENGNLVPTTEKDYILSMSANIVETLTNPEQKENFKALFCEATRSTPEFNAQVEAMYNFIQCNGYELVQYKNSAGGGKGKQDGKITDWDVRPHIPYLKVVSNANGIGQTYSYFEIDYYYQIMQVKYPEVIGLQFVTLHLINGESITVGKEITDYAILE